ncbi:MAG: type I DNA topoisomerase [Peptostreptococcaceae bacterium]|nr:type I DNA topoisomerase [Peptostreptococcaceae bacterium]MDY5739876.1 type I DNA topoisomerase [Anaerovoracaceae bacterium]
MAKSTSKKVEKKKELVIVESPSKAKTIGKYLGSKYKVVASVGHVRDLPKSKLGIDIENDFEPQYISIRGKGDLIKELKKEGKKASKIYLATDPDREGEAISWHLSNLLELDKDDPIRIEFNEITKDKVKNALKAPRTIDMNLVDAQQARRVLDRLVGYQISPILWSKVQKGLSAGRVQSAALKIICDRENAILNFIPEEYWTILADFRHDRPFTAKLAEYKDKKLKVGSKAEADEILAQLKEKEYSVSRIVRKEKKQKPYAPFTTSALQQEASSKLGFNPRKTVMIAQQLYEGVDVKGHGIVGLITYLRTDSVRISAEAKEAARHFITTALGENYFGNNFYSNKKKDIQDAHEAIRPSNVNLVPEEIEGSLSQDQFKLYRLIWRRFLASQMTPAVFDSMQVEINNGDYKFKASGSKLIFDGYKRIYTGNEEEKDNLLPELKEGEVLNIEKIYGEQNFTQPPARFSEAGLIKELEDKNIGRPSTYAPIVATLTDRKYVKRSKKMLIPTQLGFTVTNLLTEYFKEIVDVDFTANMEDKLDDVEINGSDWKNVIKDFYGPFEKELKIAEKEIEKISQEPVLTGEICEICGKPMALKSGRYGDFIACTGYPECKNAKPIVKKIDVKCPTCGGDIIQRKSKRGKTFYGCSNYPNCNQVFWYRPIEKKCPKCGSLLVEKKAKTFKFACSNSECDHKE